MKKNNSKNKLSNNTKELKNKVISEYNKSKIKFDEIKDNLKNKSGVSKKDKIDVKKIIDTIMNFINKHYKFIVILLCIIILIIIICNALNNKNDNDYYYDNEEYEEVIIKKYNVKFHVDFYENLFLNKYDVNISLDGNEETLEHGKNKDFEFEVSEGNHTIYFENADDTSINKEIKIKIDNNMEVGYKISCHTDKISVENLYVDKDVELKENEVEVKSDKKEFVGKNYKDVIQKLKDLGFTNIIEKPKYEIKEYSLYDVGEVDSVKINNSDKFKKGNIYNSDVEVVISYYLKHTDNPNKIKAPYTSDEAKSKNYKDVVKNFEEAGFTNIITKEKYITEYSGNESYNVSSIKINDSYIDLHTGYNKNDEVMIEYYVITETGASNKELTLSYAKTAFENYGEKIYKYGFKCHWIVGLINAEQLEDGSWFLKVEITIENAYGNKYKAVAEAKVSGTNNNPKVKDFYVSE